MIVVLEFFSRKNKKNIYFLKIKNFWKIKEKRVKKGTKINADKLLDIEKMLESKIINFAFKI